jgi:Dolichyl-phosphate-mannose-protein mannosyltransferase
MLLALIPSGAMIMTFFYLRQFQQTAYGQFLMVDAKVYQQKALQILQEGWLGKGVFYQAPLYPYILAGIYKIFGVQIWLVQAIRGNLFLLTITLLFQIGKILFDTRTGLLSAALAFLYGPFAYYSGLPAVDQGRPNPQEPTILWGRTTPGSKPGPSRKLYSGADRPLPLDPGLQPCGGFPRLAVSDGQGLFSSPPGPVSDTRRLHLPAPLIIRNYWHSGELILTSYRAEKITGRSLTPALYAGFIPYCFIFSWPVTFSR